MGTVKNHASFEQEPEDDEQEVADINLRDIGAGKLVRSHETQVEESSPLNKAYDGSFKFDISSSERKRHSQVWASNDHEIRSFGEQENDSYFGASLKRGNSPNILVQESQQAESPPMTAAKRQQTAY